MLAHFEGHPPAILDIEVVDGRLVITETDVPVLEPNAAWTLP